MANVKIVENNQSTLITEKCKKISKPFIRACQKHGCGVSLLETVAQTPNDVYEELYGQPTIEYGKEYELQGIFTPNPPEDFYKDNHMETKGDGVLLLLTYQLQEKGFIEIGSLNDYQSIPKNILAYHVRIGSDVYRIDEAKLNDVYQGFPLTLLLGLTFLKSLPIESKTTVEED